MDVPLHPAHPNLPNAQEVNPNNEQGAGNIAPGNPLRRQPLLNITPDTPRVLPNNPLGLQQVAPDNPEGLENICPNAAQGAGWQYDPGPLELNQVPAPAIADGQAYETALASATQALQQRFENAEAEPIATEFQALSLILGGAFASLLEQGVVVDHEGLVQLFSDCLANWAGIISAHGFEAGEINALEFQPDAPAALSAADHALTQQITNLYAEHPDDNPLQGYDPLDAGSWAIPEHNINHIITDVVGAVIDGNDERHEHLSPQLVVANLIASYYSE